jgi:hypothetical protein
VRLERGPLSHVSITEELLELKSSGFGSRKPKLMTVGSVALTTRHPLSAKFAITSSTRGGRSVCIVCLRTKATEFSSLVYTTLKYTERRSERNILMHFIKGSHLFHFVCESSVFCGVCLESCIDIACLQRLGLQPVNENLSQAHDIIFSKYFHCYVQRPTEVSN